MPELPEVEHVARSLSRVITGRRIVTADLRRERLAPESDRDSFDRSLQDSTISRVHRRGKHLLFELDNGNTLITHLRMSGRFILLPLERDDPKFAHAVFYLDGSDKLLFQDQRHFGMMKIVPTVRINETKELSKLAPEPFSDEFSPAYLRSALSGSRRALKEFLIDQTKVCGLGNIYASEAMFLARTNPKVPANSLSNRKAAALYAMIREVLREAVRHSEGAPIDPEDLDSGYFSGDGNGWRVYGREGDPCPRCSRPIARIKQGQRSTFFCRRCQRK